MVSPAPPREPIKTCPPPVARSVGLPADATNGSASATSAAQTSESFSFNWFLPVGCCAVPGAAIAPAPAWGIGGGKRAARRKLALAALPARLALLLERGSALLRVLGGHHGPGDLALLLPHLVGRPVELLLEDALGGDQRQRSVLSDCLGQLEGDLDRLVRRGEPVHHSELVEALRRHGVACQRQLHHRVVG